MIRPSSGLHLDYEGPYEGRTLTNEGPMKDPDKRTHLYNRIFKHFELICMGIREFVINMRIYESGQF